MSTPNVLHVGDQGLDCTEMIGMLCHTMLFRVMYCACILRVAVGQQGCQVAVLVMHSQACRGYNSFKHLYRCAL